VPYAAFWGVAGAVLRFIPYVGTWSAGICPFVLSLAVFEGWMKPLLTLGLFGAVELTMSGIVEPWLYATRTGISSLAILLSAAFWTILWGPIGLMVSTPLTVLLFVLGRHIPQLEFLYILLGDEPVLSPPAYYYQRLLALDEDEAREVAENYLREKTVLDLYDSVLVPALSLAEQDRHRNELDEERQKFIYDNTRDLIEEFGEIGENGPQEEKPVFRAESSISVLCVPARDESDELVALMLAQILRQTGYAVETLAAGFLEEILTKIEKCEPNVVFISALPPFGIRHARSLCRRTHHRCPGLKVVVGLWGSTAERNILQQRLGPGCSDYLVHTLAEAELQLRLLGEQLQAVQSGKSEGKTSTAPREPQHA
jgi:CheY-like chemotaxis protein